jgi:hypothetical protein
VAQGFNDDILWKSMPWYAPLGVLTIPLACIGVYFNLKERQRRSLIFLLWLVATLPIFFIYDLNSNRGNSLYLPIIALAAIGLVGLYNSIQIRRTRIALASLLLAIATIYSSAFGYDYFRHYNGLLLGTPYYVGFGQALTHATSDATTGEPIYISSQINVLHRADVTLFFLKADARDFQQHAQIKIVDGTYQVESYRNFYFVYQPVLATAPSYIAILRGSERVHCASTQLLYREPGWTVERCFNPSS